MSSRTLMIIGGFAVGALLLFVYFNRSLTLPPQGVAPQPQGVLKLGEEAPDFILPDLSGASAKLKKLRGKVVLLNFWATWCPPCITEMPALARAHEKLHDKGFEILAISLDETEKPVRQFSKQHKFPFRVLLDPKGISAHAYLVYGLPYTVLIDREGRVRHKIFGGHDWDKGKPFEKIKSLL